MRSYRRRSSVSMLANALRMSWRWLTNRLYEMTRASPTTTTIPRMIQKTITVRSSLRSRPHHRAWPGWYRTRSTPSRDMFAEHLGAAEQRDELGRPAPVRPHQQARPVHLEPEITPRAQHPVDHPRIQQLEGKLAVLGL